MPYEKFWMHNQSFSNFHAGMQEALSEINKIVYQDA